MAARVPAVLSLLLVFSGAAAPTFGAGKSQVRCADCAALNAAHKPFRIIGNTYYVGTAGIAAVLVTSDYGHALINGGLPESAAQIAANIEALGFKPTDVKGILVTEPSYVHSGGVAALARLTGAQVYGSRPAEKVMTTGKAGSDDPQAATWMAFDPVSRLWVVQDDQLLGIGSVRLRAYAMPGQSPGGMSWRWEACEGSQCVDALFLNSLKPESSPKYRFSSHPAVVRDFEASIARLESTGCELLLPSRPEAAELVRLQQAAGKAEALKQEGACKSRAADARKALQERLAGER
jgi:metallo-beta-lactamase class B